MRPLVLVGLFSFFSITASSAALVTHRAGAWSPSQDGSVDSPSETYLFSGLTVTGASFDVTLTVSGFSEANAADLQYNAAGSGLEAGLGVDAGGSDGDFITGGESLQLSMAISAFSSSSSLTQNDIQLRLETLEFEASAGAKATLAGGGNSFAFSKNDGSNSGNGLSTFDISTLGFTQQDLRSITFTPDTKGNGDWRLVGLQFDYSIAAGSPVPEPASALIGGLLAFSVLTLRVRPGRRAA